MQFQYNRKSLKLTVCTGRKHLGSEQKSCDMSIVLVITYSCDEGAQATEQFSWLPSLSCSRYTTTSAISYSNTVGYKWKKVVKTQRHDLLKLIAKSSFNKISLFPCICNLIFKPLGLLVQYFCTIVRAKHANKWKKNIGPNF